MNSKSYGINLICHSALANTDNPVFQDASSLILGAAAMKSRAKTIYYENRGKIPAAPYLSPCMIIMVGADTGNSGCYGLLG
jgi:hypothetical protein